MKKYFPILVSISVFFLLTIGQVVWDIFPLNANDSTQSEGETLAYEYALKTFQARTVEGQEFRSGFYKDKIVIVNFWASWCAPCLAEFPMLTELRTLFSKSELEIVSINTDEDEQFENIEKLSRQFNFNFDVVVDTDGFFVKKFRVESIPLSLIYYDGKLMEASYGAMDFASAENVEKFKKYLEK
jgi:thiol-disulfide isomerase/thioredoxin